MKKSTALFCLISIMLIIPFVSVQADAGFRGQSMNGSTGLFSIPTGRIGWGGRSWFGLDLGYRAIINNSIGTAHIPAITISLFRWVELSASFDFQPRVFQNYETHENNDLIFGAKIRLPTNIRNTDNPAVVIGGNAQLNNISSRHNLDYNAYQPYLAITFKGNFFTMPSETTVVIGKTFYTGRHNNSNIDFGMGFDLVLFPDVFGNAVHWIMDFSNFSYSDDAWPNHGNHDTGPAQYRGILNCGFRIDLSSFPALNKFKLLVDFVFVDLFDHVGRSFYIGAVFGFSI